MDSRISCQCHCNWDSYETDFSSQQARQVSYKNTQNSYIFCTFSNHWLWGSRNTPSILLNNYYEDINGQIRVRNLDNAYFGNCIIDGGLSTNESETITNDKGEEIVVEGEFFLELMASYSQD